jgi:hypothetical protein
MKTKLSFEAWEKEVDNCMEQMFGMSCDDLPDYDYYSAYEDNTSPKSAARAAKKAACDY